MLRGGGERGREFDAEEAAEREAEGQQQSASFAAADVDEGETGPIQSETVERAGEGGGADAIVAGGPVPGGLELFGGVEIFAPDEACGVDAVLLVEGMPTAVGGFAAGERLALDQQKKAVVHFAGEAAKAAVGDPVAGSAEVRLAGGHW